MGKIKKLCNIASFVEDKIQSDQISLSEYITTDNLLQNKQGRTIANNLPPQVCSLIRYQKGDMLISNIRPYLKKIWYATNNGGASNDVLVIRSITPELSKYVYALLLQDDFYDYTMKACKGSKMPRGDKLHIMQYPVHEIANPERIGDLFAALDDKIALNRRINEKLEAMAKRLYDYWFVQFDFPDENGRPYKSSGGKMVWNETLKREIPAGWEVKRIGERISLERGISYSTANLQGNGIPMINLGSFAIGGGYKNCNLKTYSGEYSDNKIIAPYDLLICLTQQTSIDFSKDVIGCPMLVPDIFRSDIVISQDLAKVVCCDELKYYLHQLFKTFYFHKYITGFVSGSNIMHLDASGILQHKTVIPPKSILQKYKDISQSIFTKTSKSSEEISRLTALRDRLLPLLMNGQVEVG